MASFLNTIFSICCKKISGKTTRFSNEQKSYNKYLYTPQTHRDHFND